MPSPNIGNPAGAFGLSTTGSDQATVLGNYVAATAVSRGEVCCLSSTTGQIIRALTNTAQGLQVGIAAQDIATGAAGLVVEGGRFFSVKKDTAAALTAGNFVTRSASTTGTVAVLSAATAVTTYGDAGKAIGVVMADATAAAAVVDVFVCKF